MQADLQADFKIIPVGTSQAGGWRYSFVYDLVHRHFPELLIQARSIKESDARLKIAELYLLSVGAATRRDFQKLFHWSPKQLQAVLDELACSGNIHRQMQIKDNPDEWIALNQVL